MYDFGIEAISNDQIKTLSECLKRQVARIKYDDVIEQHSVFIRHLEEEKTSPKLKNDIKKGEQEERGLRKEQSEAVEDDDTNHINLKKGRYYNIKSLKVQWNCKPSTMHVFIDTTDILKLEEANNSIKHQKIMFSSASHEFRTPLNAILNACDIVKQCFHQIVKVVDKSTISSHQKRAIQKNSEMIQKFLRIGKNSSELLLALVEDVLNLSKMESNIFVLNISEFYVEDLINEVTDMFEYQ